MHKDCDSKGKHKKHKKKKHKHKKDKFKNDTSKALKDVYEQNEEKLEDQNSGSCSEEDVDKLGDHSNKIKSS